MPEPVTRPLNLGHRGARSLAPENTLAGMAVAMQVGAHGVEFDVQRTADGHLVVFHDDDLKRICSVDGRIVASTLAQLRELDAGRHFGPQFAGELIPTLNEVIENSACPRLPQHRGQALSLPQRRAGGRHRAGVSPL
ncbi:MAG: glycerophosphodiester phosphodiesterase family protein [Anaerolineae bacterium]